MLHAIRRTLVALSCAAALAGLTACETRPDFDVDKAQNEIASAFAREPIAVQVLGDGRGADSDSWIVDFRLDGYDPFLQAKFVGRNHRWELDTVRERPSGPNETPWTEIGTMLGRFRGATLERARQTEEIIRALAGFVERYAVEHGNKFPVTNLEGVRKLVVGAGYVEESKWRHDVDGWGNAMAYHAANDGQSYIAISPGADGRWDLPLDEYFQNTDQGLEAYGGDVTDPNKDFIMASGSFVQVYRP